MQGEKKLRRYQFNESMAANSSKSLVQRRFAISLRVGHHESFCEGWRQRAPGSAGLRERQRHRLVRFVMTTTNSCWAGVCGYLVWLSLGFNAQGGCNFAL